MRKTDKSNRIAGGSPSASGGLTVSRPASAGFLRKVYDYYRALTGARAGLRHRLPMEHGVEETQQLKPFDRLEAIAIGRDLARNNAKAITLMEQRKTLVAGRIHAQFNTPYEAWNAAADRVFNVFFSRDCFYEYPLNLADCVQLVEAALIREGDCLIAYDDDDSIFFDSGKLLIWEADQLVTVNSADWADPVKNPVYRDAAGNPYYQDQGVIVAPDKRVVAYAVSALHLSDTRRGVVSMPIADVTIIPAGACRLAAHRFRFGQRRGVPELLPVADNIADIDELVKSELSTARLRSKILAWVKTKAASGIPGDQAAALALRLAEYDAENSAETESETAAAANAEPEIVEKKAYRKIDEATGGMLEYLDPDDDVSMPSMDRPNLQTVEFYNALSDAAGASLGLARGYARLEVGNSYTAHRGETCMTDRHIRNHQKNHEHQWLDWLAEKVIARAIRLGAIPPGPDGWAHAVSWEFPRPDVIDDTKAAAADAANLKNGVANFRDLLGPRWREKLRETADQLAFARELGLPLSIFETVSGAAATPPPDGKTQPNEEQ